MKPSRIWPAIKSSRAASRTSSRPIALLLREQQAIPTTVMVRAMRRVSSWLHRRFSRDPRKPEAGGFGQARRRGQNLPPEHCSNSFCSVRGCGGLSRDALWRWRRHQPSAPAIETNPIEIAVTKQLVYPTSSQRPFWVKSGSGQPLAMRTYAHNVGNMDGSHFGKGFVPPQRNRGDFPERIATQFRRRLRPSRCLSVLFGAPPTPPFGVSWRC